MVDAARLCGKLASQEPWFTQSELLGSIFYNVTVPFEAENSTAQISAVLTAADQCVCNSPSQSRWSAPATPTSPTALLLAQTPQQPQFLRARYSTSTPTATSTPSNSPFIMYPVFL